MRLVAVAALLLAAAPAFAAPAVTPIKAGTYHCIAGSSRMMLTLGDVKISGNRYVFTDPQHHVTSGTWSMTPAGYHWSGDSAG